MNILMFISVLVIFPAVSSNMGKGALVNRLDFSPVRTRKVIKEPPLPPYADDIQKKDPSDILITCSDVKFPKDAVCILDEIRELDVVNYVDTYKTLTLSYKHPERAEVDCEVTLTAAADKAKTLRYDSAKCSHIYWYDELEDVSVPHFHLSNVTEFKLYADTREHSSCTVLLKPYSAPNTSVRGEFGDYGVVFKFLSVQCDDKYSVFEPQFSKGSGTKSTYFRGNGYRIE